ncbi:MAG: LCP family protein [Anaerotardibacter sp.]
MEQRNQQNNNQRFNEVDKQPKTPRHAKHVSPDYDWNSNLGDSTSWDSSEVIGKHAKHAASAKRNLQHSFNVTVPTFAEMVAKTETLATAEVSATAETQELDSYTSKNRAKYSVKQQGNKKGRIAKRVICVLLALLLVFGGSLGAYALMLNDALKLDSDKQTEISSVLSEVEANEPFYMLLVGSDSREGSGTSSNPAMQGDQERSDVMILLRVDAENRKITMVSVPRDTPYTWPDGTITKLNEVYNVEGAAGTIRAVSEVTGVKISHYAEVHFSNFGEMIDSIGGIEVTVPQKISYKDALTGEMVTIEAGTQVLNGQQAQIFARVRKVYGDNQEAKRQSNNRQIIEAILDRVKSKPLYEMPGTVLNIANCVSTDMNAGDLIPLALSMLGGSGKLTMYSCTGPSDGDYVESLGGLWLCYENPEGWAKLMDVVDSGENPSKVDVSDTQIPWN